MRLKKTWQNPLGFHLSSPLSFSSSCFNSILISISRHSAVSPFSIEQTEFADIFPQPDQNSLPARTLTLRSSTPDYHIIDIIQFSERLEKGLNKSGSSCRLVVNILAAYYDYSSLLASSRSHHSIISSIKFYYHRASSMLYHDNSSDVVVSEVRELQ